VCDQPIASSASGDVLLIVQTIEKLCKFWSVILVGTWCSPGKKWYSTFDTTGSVPSSNTYWLSVAQGWDGQLTALVKLSGKTYNISVDKEIQVWIDRSINIL